MVWTSSASAKHLLVFGDSLSAAYGMDIEQGWVHLLKDSLNELEESSTDLKESLTELEESSADLKESLTELEESSADLDESSTKFKESSTELKESPTDLSKPLNKAKTNAYQVSNASISGETSAGGLTRLELTLKEFNPDVVLLELGANDGLKGYPVDKMADNLNAMLDMIDQSGATAVLLGISIPPSYGPRYVDQFRLVYKTIAEQRQLPFIDLYREEFYLTPGYMQRDGLHPTAITQPIIRDLMLTFLEQENVL